MTPEDAAYLKSQGWSDYEIANAQLVQQPEMGKGQAALSTAKAHAGSYLGGGAGAIGGMAIGGLLAPETGGLSLAIPLIGAAIGGAGGGYAGQKAQQAIESPETYAAQQQQAELAAEQHPYISMGTDIGASALASGGKPSLNALRSVRGLIGAARGEEGAGSLIARQKDLMARAEQAIKNNDINGANDIAAQLNDVNSRLPAAIQTRDAMFSTALNAGINPAINTGISYATIGQMPSGADIAAQALGGAVFSGQAGWARRLIGHEPNAEVNDKGTTDEQQTSTSTAPDFVSPFTARDDTTGQYKLSNATIKRIFLGRMATKVPKDADDITKGYIQSRNEQLRAMPVDDMRAALHQQEAEKSVTEPSVETSDYVGGEMPELKGLNYDDTIPPTTPKQVEQPKTITPQAETPTIFKPEILQEIIDKGATKPIAVKRIFPNLNLTDDEAASALHQAQLLAELHENHPNYTGDENATGIRENQGLPNEGGKVGEGREENRSNDLVEKTPGSEAQPIPPRVSNNLSDEERLVKQQRLEDETKNSPLSDYNRYQELVRQLQQSKSLDETQALQKELESIKNKYGGKPPPKFPENNVLMPVVLQHHIISNRATTGSVLYGLANTPDHPLQPLAKALLDAADAKSLNVKWIHDNNLDKEGQSRSHYSLGNDEVRIGTGSAGDARVVMEEAVHSLTSKKIPYFKGQGEEHYNRLNAYLKTGKNEAVKDLIRSYFEVAKHLGADKLLFSDKYGVAGTAGNPDLTVASRLPHGTTTKYAMGNLDEFIAQALKDPEFRRVLDGIKTSDNRSVWQKIVDAVRNLLGLSAKEGSMLDRVLRSSGELVSQERPTDTERRMDIANSRFSNDAWMDKSGNLHEGPEHYQIAKEGESVTPEHPTFLGGVGRFMTNAILRARGVSPDVADAYHKFFIERQRTFGNVYGRVKNVMDRTGFTTQDGHRLMEAMRREELTKNPVPMSFFKNQAQKQVWQEYKKVYREQGEEAVKDKQPVFDYHTKQYRIRQLSDVSHPLMLNTKIADILRNATDVKRIEQLHQEFIADQVKRGVKEPDAEKNYQQVVDALRGQASRTGDVGMMNRFNANRRAQGIPLPDTWTKQDFEDNLYSYAARNAADRAHYKAIETNPSVMRQLGETQDAWGRQLPPSDKPIIANNKFVNALIRESHGEVGPQGFYTERAGSGLATALFISSPALSAVHVPISNIAAITSLADNPLQLSKALFSGIKGMTSGIATAQANGLLVPRARPAARMFDASLTSAEKLQTFASVIRRIASFNDLVTKANIGYMQAAMESIVPSKLIRANDGNHSAQQFMRKLDPSYKVGKDYSPEEMSHLATEAVGYLHGTNDPRTMPEWMLHDSEISGFFSIAHWSVAQTDRFMRDVWMPAKQGNLSPLILGIAGAAVGGYAVKVLREQISGKHSPIPGLTEIINSDRGIEGNAGPLAYNAMAALQFAGFGGLFSQLAKYPFDLAYKNMSQALAFPLDQEVSDIAKTAGQVASAIMNDPNINFVDLAKLVSQHVLTSDFRLAREGYHQLINAGMIQGTLAERKFLADNMSKLRRFEQVEGLPFDEMTAPNENPYMFPEQQEFKRTQDLGEATRELPTLMQNIMQQYGQNPDVAMAKLKSLKDMQYNTMPSIENYPLSFQKYLAYLSRMEGPQAMQQALMDYQKHRLTNEIKGSLVP